MLSTVSLLSSVIRANAVVFWINSSSGRNKYLASVWAFQYHIPLLKTLLGLCIKACAVALKVYDATKTADDVNNQTTLQFALQQRQIVFNAVWSNAFTDIHIQVFLGETSGKEVLNAWRKCLMDSSVNGIPVPE